MQKKEKYAVAVVFGGDSFEWEISVLTGVLCCNLLKESYFVLPVFLRGKAFFTSPKMFSLKSFQSATPFQKLHFVKGGVRTEGLGGKTIQLDCVLNACHGGWGEGGGLAAFLQAFSIPFASPQERVSGIFMDKYLTKLVLGGLGVNTVDYCLAEDGKVSVEEVEQKVGFPCVIKPVTLGSSLGIEVVERKEDFLAAVKRSFAYDKRCVVEKYLPDKRDINCAAYYTKGEVVVSECEEAVSSDKILSFAEKYTKPNKNVFPAQIGSDVKKEIREIAKKIYQGLNFRGVVRFDFLLCGNKVYFNEGNTVPGSLAYYLFAPRLKEGAKWLQALVREGIDGGKREKTNSVTEMKILPTLPPTAIIRK